MNKQHDLIAGSFFIVPLGSHWEVAFFPDAQTEYWGVSTVLSKFALLHVLRTFNVSAENIDKVEMVEDDPDGSYSIDLKVSVALDILKRFQLLSTKTAKPPLDGPK
ncbi:MAG TPA: hypothetical protein V6C97_04305 [Oculatellaceae cyanobacterium]